MPIQQLSAELQRVVSTDAEPEELGSGYQLAEGPVWYHEGGYLLYSDIRNNRRMRWEPSTGTSVALDPSNFTNGMTRDAQGRLVFCEQGLRRMSRLELDGRVTIIADSYGGKRFNRPNDVVVHSDGSIYFTDPITGRIEPELDFLGVYRVPSDLSSVQLLTPDIHFPNGLAFSVDEKQLYINSSRVGLIHVYDVATDGSISNGRVFCELKGDAEGNPDGMKLDLEGNVYCTGPGGLWIINPTGQHLGTVLAPESHITNCAWGENDWKTLFFTTFNGVYRIQMKATGVPVPR